MGGRPSEEAASRMCLMVCASISASDMGSAPSDTLHTRALLARDSVSEAKVVCRASMYMRTSRMGEMTWRSEPADEQQGWRASAAQLNDARGGMKAHARSSCPHLVPTVLRNRLKSE